jgi:hypothetical protein
MHLHRILAKLAGCIDRAKSYVSIRFETCVCVWLAVTDYPRSSCRRGDYSLPNDMPFKPLAQDSFVWTITKSMYFG